MAVGEATCPCWLGESWELESVLLEVKESGGSLGVHIKSLLTVTGDLDAGHFGSSSLDLR